MTTAQGRSQAIREIAETLTRHRELEVDHLLRSVDAAKVTPAGWSQMAERRRREILLMLLDKMDDEVIFALTLVIRDINDLSGTVRASAQYFLDLSEGEADQLLREAGATTATPAGWGLWEDDRRIDAMSLLIASQSQEVVNRLGLLVSVPASPVQGELLRSEQEEAIGRQTDNDTNTIGLGANDPAASSAPIFVVHGHAKVILHETVRVVERATAREAIVLHEKANEGRTLLEKFEHNAQSAAYAVVLLTADDLGKVRTDESAQPRGRQNVVFELGFFFGKLGRSRVVVLIDPDIEKPSDIDGLVYIPLDSPGAWKPALVRELHAAGIKVDYTRIP